MFGDVLDSGYRAFLPVLESLVNHRAACVHYAHYAPPSGFHATRRREIACALEAAARQGMFWPYHRLLLTEWVSVNRAGLVHRAHFLGMSVERFEHDLILDEVSHAVDHDTDWADELGVRRLPAIAIDGRHYDGSLQRTAILAALGG